MKKLYVVCPANIKTGGPELLHQLVSVLNKLGVNAEIAYVNIVYGQHPTHTEYKQYVDEFVDFNDILDDRNNIIIFPESYTKQLYKFKNALKVIWWLSVDNAGSFKYRNKFRERFKRWLNALTGVILCKYYYDSIFLADLHLYQSEYARRYLQDLGVNSALALSDYLNDSFFEQSFSYDKEDIVLYNPKKGYEFTKKIIEAAKGEIYFAPIQNYTTEQVSDLLLKSKCYIDFGNHPGKDRFPREAAISGCCVITGKKGSANNDIDVSIPNNYKFVDDEKYIDEILDKIRYCIKSYNIAIDDFENYRHTIMNEKAVFESQAQILVDKLYKL